MTTFPGSPVFMTKWSTFPTSSIATIGFESNCFCKSQSSRKCCSAAAPLRAEQGPCEPSEDVVRKFGAIGSLRGQERARGSQREQESKPERARESQREPE